ncbi:MAG: type II secretion system protein N [Pseudomonadota bacterium]
MAGAIVGLLATGIANAPARWLAAGVEAAADGHVLLAAPRGTVWNGSAQLVLAGGAGSTDSAALPDRLQWRLRPAWAGVRAELRADCCTPEPLALAASWGWSGLRFAVADGASRWPAALLAGLGTPWNTLQPEGTLALRTTGLVLTAAAGRLAVAGGATLDAEAMSSRLSTLRPMGSYRLTLAGGDVPALQLQTFDGALRLAGAGQWVGARLRFTGEASAAPDREAALSNLLNIIGRRTGATSVITVG